MKIKLHSNEKIEWMKWAFFNELILWKLSSIKMEILNDIAWNLN